MATAREWVEGARLRTLPASIAPVVVGTGVAWFVSRYSAPPFRPGGALRVWDVAAPLLCLLVAVFLQVGSNFSNDYSDGVRGTDAERVGPQRLVGSGAASPKQVKRAAMVSFALSCLAGLSLLAWYGRWLSPKTWQALSTSPNTVGPTLVLPIVFIGIGLACVAAAWFYTGGKRPYGYAGLGEVFVFVFFGLVATIGTTVIQVRMVCPSCPPEVGRIDPCVPDMPWAVAILSGAVMGCLSVAILVANNLRDIDTDLASGKRTLPTRLGDENTRTLYVALLVAALAFLIMIAAVSTWWALLSVLGLALTVRPTLRVRRGATGRELVTVLAATGRAELAVAILLFVGLTVGWING